jgi:hypothetical protein
MKTRFLPRALASASLSIVLLSQVALAQEQADGGAQGDPPAQGVAPASQPLPPPPAPPLAMTPPAAPPGMTPPSYPYAYQPWGYGPQAGSPAGPFVDAGPPPVVMESRWYGWQTLLADVAAVAAASAGGEAGLGVYALGGPIVHWSHGNTGRGFGSLALRTGAPIVLGAAFVAGCDPDEDAEFGCLGAALAGVGLGMVTAIVLDASVLARDEVPVERDTSVALGPVRVMPNIVVGSDSASLVLQGSLPSSF